MERIRYQATHEREPGFRILSVPNQGRHHKDRKEDAQAWLDAVRESLVEKQVLTPAQAATLEVRPIKCFENGDAMGTCGHVILPKDYHP
jgi:hypothetical protein